MWSVVKVVLIRARHSAGVLEGMVYWWEVVLGRWRVVVRVRKGRKRRSGRILDVVVSSIVVRSE